MNAYLSCKPHKTEYKTEEAASVHANIRAMIPPGNPTQIFSVPVWKRKLYLMYFAGSSFFAAWAGWAAEILLFTSFSKAILVFSVVWSAIKDN